MRNRSHPTNAFAWLTTLPALLLLLAACSQSPAPRAVNRGAVSQDVIAKVNPQPPLPPSFPGLLNQLAEPLVVPATPGAVIRPMAVGDVEVELKVLVITATTSEIDVPSYWAWRALLDQTGTPYDVLVASEEELTSEHLVGADGVGRYQAVLLATSELAMTVDREWVSQFTGDEWETLFQYEREFGVRQVALFAFPGTAPEGYGVVWDPEAGGDLTGTRLTTTAAGRELFPSLAPGAVMELVSTWGYPASLEPGSVSVPLLQDADGRILAVSSTTDDGRERVALFFNNGSWALHTKLLGPDLLRWATNGVYIGERRNSFAADVDDWFIPTGIWDMETQDYSDDEEFFLSAQDAHSFAQQQAALRSAHPGVTDGLTFTMAFNGEGADLAHVVECDAATSDHSLSSITRCLADDFWWVNHTWGHDYMDRNPPYYDISYEEILAQITQNDAIVGPLGLGATNQGRSLVTGDISGLGWYSPEGPDSGEKIDHGLEYSNPDLLRAVVDTGRSYLASNMSTPSHEPDCWACGIIHPENPGVFLVPRWPTNLFAPMAFPEQQVQLYNLFYAPGGKWPTFDHELTYEEVLDADTDVALGHLVSGSPYPHYFHVANLNEYEPGRSLLGDWTGVLLGKYAALLRLPLLVPSWDRFGAYVRQRTEFADAGVSGRLNKGTGEVTITSASGGAAFVTGFTLGAGARDSLYGGQLISQRDLAPGETLVLRLDAPANPYSDPYPDPAPDPGPVTAYVLTTAVVGEGSVTGAGTYQADVIAAVAATPATDWRFTGWSGDLSGSTNPTTILMSADRSVTATFAPKLAQAITFDALPDRATGDAPFQVSATSNSGLPVTFGASGACLVEGSLVTLSGAVGSCTITASQPGDETHLAAESVSRTFDVAAAPVRTYALALQVVGNGAGALIVSPGGFACSDSCTLSLPEGEMVTITAVGIPGSSFTGFSSSCSGDACTLLMTTDARVNGRFARGR